jgi:competence ComEA-like helix-hairpin-helix protein
MKKKQADVRIVGGLFLLFFLLFVHALCSFFCCTSVTELQSGKKVHDVCNAEMTCFHKITLGMPVPINTGSFDSLTAVPGIGPKLAELIIRERESIGGFKSLDEILSIKGIGPALYGKISPYLVL